MFLLRKILHLLITFFSGWQPRDYVTTIIALAALILSLRKERRDWPRIGVQFHYERASTSFKDVYAISVAIEATNTGGQPMVLRWAGVELWDSGAKQFFKFTSDNKFTLQRAESAVYRMEVGFRRIGGDNFSHRYSVFNVLTTAVAVEDDTGRRWELRKRDLASSNGFTSKGYPAFDLQELSLGKWSKRWLLVRLHFFFLRQCAWRIIRRNTKEWTGA